LHDTVYHIFAKLYVVVGRIETASYRKCTESAVIRHTMYKISE